MDDIKFVIPFEEEIDMSNVNFGEKIDLRGVTYSPEIRDGKFRYYRVKMDNMIFTLFPDRLVVNNSWHKFYKGNNYSDYTLEDIEKTIYKISNLIGFDILDADVKKVTYGIVIETDAKTNYSSWLNYKSTEPAPMIKVAKVYGRKFYLTDFNIKGYDKTYEVRANQGLKLEKKLYRVEVEVKNMKHLNKRANPLHIYKVRDLIDYEKVQMLMDDLITKHDTINKDNVYDFDKMSNKDSEALSKLRFGQYKDYLRKKKNKTFKRYKRRVSDINSNIENSIHTQTKRLIIEKISNLINS